MLLEEIGIRESLIRFNQIKKFSKNKAIFLFKNCSYLSILNNSDINKNYMNDWDFYSGSYNSNIILTPWYVTGISDGEGSFQITIQDIKGKGYTGYKPFLEFKVTQKSHSLGILLELKKFFDCGRIIIDNRKTDTMKFVITNVDDLMHKLIAHFEKYPLVTSKQLNYIDFKSAVILMSNKKHYTRVGIDILKDIKSKMNRARLFKDKYDFCWGNDIILEEEWIQGFFSLSCKTISHWNEPSPSINPWINFSLQIKQNKHDVAVLNAIKNFFQKGYLKPKYNIKNIEATYNSPWDTTSLWIRDTEIICKFLDQYPLYTVKRLDYLDWKQWIGLKKINAHFTKKGLELMQKIKNNMNANRFK